MSSIATRSAVPADDAADFVLAAANPDRAVAGVTIYNESSDDLYVGLGDTTVTAANYTVILVSGAYYETPWSWIGQIRGLSAAGAAGNILVTELE